MGICESKIKVTEGRIKGAIPEQLLKTTNLYDMEKYICKIKINDKNFGTGFFCKIEYNNKIIPALITNYHVINDEFLEVNKYIEVYIKNESHLIEINKDSKIYSSISSEYDIMIIKINQDNEDIRDYLEIDPNIYKEDSLSTYKNEDIYILHYKKDGRAYISSGNGIEPDGINDIKHKCNTDHGSSGAPILSSLTNKVIGIHKLFLESRNFNLGTFLKFPLDELEHINNYIIAELFIAEERTNENIRIINSYEEVTKRFIIGHNLKEEEYKNEEEIKKCQITINDEPIPFNYFHKFKSKGKNIIKYSFKDYLTKMNQMFMDCSDLRNIDLSNFKTQKVTNMNGMFEGCISLNSVNLSNINTQKVNNMADMFNGCTFLKNINLSNVSAKNVVNMDNMFQICLSLRKENVIANDERILKQLEKDLRDLDYVKNIMTNNSA